MGVAVAQFIGAAISGSNCTANVVVCADAAECAGDQSPCAGPGVDGILACCNEEHVCASMFGGDSFSCMPEDLVGTSETAQVLECPETPPSGADMA